MRCHTTACRPSVCGVTRPGSPVGITTHASATRASSPPSRPATPAIRAPRSRARCIASTRLTLMPRSTSPPPTENANRQSSPRRREALSQSAYDDCQPSSLIRAVSSDTLSVTEYDSMSQSLRKSQAAWDAWPAPPPDPHRKSLPPRARVAASTSTTASSWTRSSRWTTAAVSSRNCSAKVGIVTDPWTNNAMVVVRPLGARAKLHRWAPLGWPVDCERPPSEALLAKSGRRSRRDRRRRPLPHVRVLLSGGGLEPELALRPRTGRRRGAHPAHRRLPHEHG